MSATEYGAEVRSLSVVAAMMTSPPEATTARLNATSSGRVVVTPVSYIFEEEPEAYRQLLVALAE